MHTVKLDEAQKRLAELIEEAANGEEVVISHGDGAAVRLVPVVVAPERKPRQGGRARGLITMRDDFDAPLPDFEPYT